MSATHSHAQTLAAIAHWVAQHAPDLPPMFRPGASEAEMAEAECQLGLPLPPMLRALYAIADGQTEGAATLLDAFAWMPLSEVVDRAAFLNEFFPGGINEEDPDHEPMQVDAGIRPTWWWPQWLPIMANGGGDYLCVDLDPAPGGQPGQVLAYFHDETYRSLVAPGVEGLIEHVARGLANGTLDLTDGMLCEV
ncbi:SMI1/KNR4 family protein [Pseudomonas sp. MF4836]|uniref:SMI1/KNR4 family protein n=1 Tax=Pseudomonas sp. MF4836 TaxID=1960827 RepID=UPI00099873E1|nr:SMI1/KNR4 family protein [Pseudomonas sp. MF4836]OOV98079.1 hypothetical protein MF4836_06900 [Pseudomonas sp. MF4836]